MKLKNEIVVQEIYEVKETQPDIIESPAPDSAEDILKDTQHIEKFVQASPDSEYSVEKLTMHAKFFFDPYISATKSKHFGQDEGYFTKQFGYLKQQDEPPPVLLHRLRISFWNQYEIAVCNQRPSMLMSQVHGGLCTRVAFANLIWNDLYMCFLLCPPSSYAAIAKEALYFGMERIRDILAAKIVDDDGNLNPRAAEVVLKAVMMLDSRVKGAVVQKIDQRTLQVTQHLGTPTQQFQNKKSMDELDKLIDETKRRLNILPEKNENEKETLQVIDVQPKSD